MENHRIKELTNLAKVYTSNKDIDFIMRAIEFSSKAHDNQIRKSGEPYVNHPIEVSKILASIKLDTASIVSGLLHDTIEDTSISLEEIKNLFGEEVADLVEGLTKINKYSLKVNNPTFISLTSYIGFPSAFIIPSATPIMSFRRINFFKEI